MVKPPLLPNPIIVQKILNREPFIFIPQTEEEKMFNLMLISQILIKRSEQLINRINDSYLQY
jgi:hypothetical protein